MAPSPGLRFTWEQARPGTTAAVQGQCYPTQCLSLDFKFFKFYGRKVVKPRQPPPSDLGSCVSPAVTPTLTPSVCSVFLPNKSRYGGIWQMGKLRHGSGLGKWRGSAAELEAESPDTCLGQGDLHVHPEISHPRYPLCACESPTREATSVPACISVSPSPPSPVSLSLPESRCFSLPDHAKIPATPSPPPASPCYRHPLHEETHVPSPRHARCPRALLCPAVPAAMPSGHGGLATHNKAVFLSMLCCSRLL